MPEFCNMSRNKMCYIILALSIIFFLSSVCTFAVLAMTKEDRIIPRKIEQIDNSPQVEQKRIIKRLKRIEDRMKKRNKKQKRNR
jgi:hypothetical protein